VTIGGKYDSEVTETRKINELEELKKYSKIQNN